MHHAPELPGPRLGLVIASTSYTDPGLAQLRAPAQDAAEMIEVLSDPGIGGFDVTPVLDRPEYEIRRAVDKFLTGRGLDDLVVLYLSCHGVLDGRGRLYFAAADTVKTQLSSTAVESAWLLDRLEECRARRQVLILDCCFSGAFARTKGGTEVDLERRLVGAGRGRAVLTASRAGEYSYEGTPLPDAPATKSVFTAALIDGLRSGNADRDGNGYISVEDAYIYAANQVKAVDGGQSPQRWLYGAEGEIILARNPHGVVVTATPLPEALRLSLDNPYPNIRRGAVATLGEWLTSADPGKVLAAQQALQVVASHDSPIVAAAARDLLQATEPATQPAPITDRPTTAPRPAHPAADPVSLAALPQRCLWAMKGHTKSAQAVAFSPDGRLLASASTDGTVRLWDPQTGQPHPVAESLTSRTTTARMVVFSPDGRLVASTSIGKTVRLWDPQTGRPMGEPFTGHTSPVRAVAFSPDGRLLASAGDDKTVRLWDPQTGRPIGEPLNGHTDTVWMVTFSSDGRLLASASADMTVRLWDPNTGHPIGQPLVGHANTVRAVAFSPDSRLLASASTDMTVRLWNPNTGHPIGQPLTAHTDTVRAVAFSPDSRVLASASADKTVRLWDPQTGQPIGELTGHTKTVRAVAFSPDGLLLASAGDDKTVRLWGP